MELNIGTPAFNRFPETARPESTVFVVDHDRYVRKSLERLILTEGLVAKTFSSAEEFLSCPRKTSPCCLVVEVALPGLSGLELQRRLAAQSNIPIIFVTDHSDVPTTVQAMKAGAVEFLTKPLRNEALVKAIHDAIDSSRAALQQASRLDTLKERYKSLTPRERDVMALVVSGLLNKQVGGELGISEITVKTHRGRAMRKMKADSLPDLVTMAALLGVQSARRH